MMTESLQGKLTTLRKVISDMQSVLVAFSGGIDSTVVLKIAHEQLGEQCAGRHRCLTDISRRSNSTARSKSPQRSARGMNWSTPINSIFQPSCRTMQPVASIARPISINCWTGCANLARASGLWTGRISTISGTIDQESKPHASGEFEVRWSKPPSRSPMCGHSPRLWDSQIGISRQPPASLPEFLAAFRSRSKSLRRVEQAEEILQAEGFRHVRVREHGEIARIEVGVEEFSRLNQPDLRAHISARLRKAGFRFVCVDLEGYRPGGISLG